MNKVEFRLIECSHSIVLIPTQSKTEMCQSIKPIHSRNYENRWNDWHNVISVSYLTWAFYIECSVEIHLNDLTTKYSISLNRVFYLSSWVESTVISSIPFIVWKAMEITEATLPVFRLCHWIGFAPYTVHRNNRLEITHLKPELVFFIPGVLLFVFISVFANRLFFNVRLYQSDVIK